MNAQQRKYLIDEIKKSAEVQIKALKSSKTEGPSLSNYLLHAVMAGDFEIKSNEEIKALILDKALNSKENSSSWLATTKGAYSAFNSGSDVTFKAKDFFIIPESFKQKCDEWRKEEERIDNLIWDVESKLKGLTTRIMLASDKTLQRMINEVDDMGDLSLIDESLKIGNGGDSSPKLLQ